MSKTTICLANGKTRKMTGLPVAAGLVAHQTPDSSDLFNVTHTESGLAVVLALTNEDLPETIKQLNTLDWTLSAENISTSDVHFEIVKKLTMDLNKKKSLKQENKLAKELGGRVQPASGARWGYRRDVVTPNFLIEAKTTEKERLSIKNKDLKQLKEQAYLVGKTPLFIIEFQQRADVVVLPQDDLELVCGELSYERHVDFGQRSNMVVDKVMLRTLEKIDFIRISGTSGSYVVMRYDTFIDLPIGSNDD